jgi:hypothetical protein
MAWLGVAVVVVLLDGTTALTSSLLSGPTTAATAVIAAAMPITASSWPSSSRATACTGPRSGDVRRAGSGTVIAQGLPGSSASLRRP